MPCGSAYDLAIKPYSLNPFTSNHTCAPLSIDQHMQGPGLTLTDTGIRCLVQIVLQMTNPVLLQVLPVAQCVWKVSIGVMLVAFRLQDDDGQDVFAANLRH